MAYEANITVDVGTFYTVVGTGQATTALITLTNPKAKTVTQTAPGAPIIVWKKLYLNFVMAGASTYALAGIAFKDLNPDVGNKIKGVKGRRKGNGSGNMPKNTITIAENAAGDTTIRVYDNFTSSAKPPNQPKWEVLLMVQNEPGDVGVIDPDIENQD